MVASATISWLIGVNSFLVSAIVAMAVLISRLRERVARLEEWIRLQEKE